MILPNVNYQEINHIEAINPISATPNISENAVNYTGAAITESSEGEIAVNNIEIFLENNSDIIPLFTNNIEATTSQDANQEAPSETRENQLLETEEIIGEEINTVKLNIENYPELAKFSNINNTIAISDYIDSQKRYRVLNILSPATDTQNHIESLEVLDCQPFLSSPVSCLRKSPELEKLVSKFSEHKQKDFLVNSNNNGIPDIAKAYLVLENKFYYSILPGIHDAWNQGKQTLVLLENRQNLPLLLDQWRNENFQILQGLHWWHQIAELWDACQEWHCTQSLLILDNLRIDEDQSLCLLSLYPDGKDFTPTLPDLGETWQQLLNNSQKTQLGAVTRLVDDLKLGAIASIEELKSRINSIASELADTQKPQLYISPPTLSSSTRLQLETKNFLPEDDDDEFTAGGNDLPTTVLPMQLISLEDAEHTDVGRTRQQNEDYFGISTKITKIELPHNRIVHADSFYILCDGMGGHSGGEIASRLAVDTLKEYFHFHWQDELPDETIINQAVQAANQAIYDVNQKETRTGSGRMGTTLVMALIHDTKIAIAHVGDSRLYSVTRRSGLQQLTIDHEVGMREIKRGVDQEIAYGRPDAYQLTQALGPRSEDFVHPDIQFLDLNEDTLLLLCSDGLTDNQLIETHWLSYLKPFLNPHTNLDQGVRQLINLANEHNGHDNITAILIRALVRPCRA